MGTATMGALAFVATLFQTPGLAGPVEIARIAVVVTVLGVTALLSVWWDDSLGFAAAAIPGGGAADVVAPYLTGAFGPTRVAPAAFLFALLGGLLDISPVVAWRGRPSARRRSTTSSAVRRRGRDRVTPARRVR